MSANYERRLRDARELLPGPHQVVTASARTRALHSFRRRRATGRAVMLAAAALVIALGLGASAGTVVAPSGIASGGPRGLGFLPQPDWYVLQAGAAASTSRPAVAVASNVPIAGDDDMRGLAESSGLPYSTLLDLPPRGVVIVAIFTPQDTSAGGDSSIQRFEPAKLPLRIERAVRYVPTTFQVRHDIPLGQYAIRAGAYGHNIDITIYFGRETPDGAQLAAAQRQLAGLVVRPAASRKSVDARRPAAPASAPLRAASVFDRTVACQTQPSGGVHEIETRAHDGVREMGSSRWLKLPFAVVASGGMQSSEHLLDGNSLVWVTSGRPVSTTTIDYNFDANYGWPSGVHPLATGTFGLSTRNCRTTSAKIPLNHAGLRGGSPGQLGTSVDCMTPRRVLLRVRAVFASSPKLNRRGGYLRTTETLTSAAFAVRTEKGKPVVYAETFKSGMTKLFTARACEED